MRKWIDTQLKTTYCRACRPIEKGDFDNSELHFGTCQECGRTSRVILQGYYDSIPKKRIKEYVDLGPELRQYLDSLRKKRNKRYLDDTLLAIMLNKNENDGIMEAVEKANITSETRKELIGLLNKCGVNKGDYK